MNIDFKVLPRACVYGVVDELSGRFYVNYMVSAGASIGKLYDLFAGVAGDYQFKVLSVTTDIETLKLHTEYWRESYRGLGWAELYPAGRKSLQYVVRALVDGDYDTVQVCLVNSRGDRKVVGVFGNMGEAGIFIETCYAADNSVNLPVYAANSRTREFLAELEDRNRTIIDI